MKYIVLVALMLVAGRAAQAHSGNDEAVCDHRDAPFEELVAACTAVIESGDFDSVPWPFARRALSYSDNELYTEAIADFDRSLAIDPDYPYALGNRASALVDMNNPAAALVNTTRLIAVEPDDYWNFYFHGVVLRELERNEEARVALERSIELRDDFFLSRWRLGFVLSDLGEFAQATALMQRTSELWPFDADVYRQLGRTYLDDEKPALAARNFRIATTLNPNLGNYDRDRVSEVPPQPPLAYQPPEQGLKLQYLQVIVPRDMRSDMELAIQEIANWFRAEPKAKPEASAIMTRTMTGTGDAVTMALRVDLEENMDKFIAPGATLPESVESFRGLFLNEIRPRGMNGPVFQVAYDGADPADLWPLKVGNEVNGTGRFLLKCPDGFQMESMVLGCRIGMEIVELGTLQYNLFVEKVETAFVPMGEYVSYVVRYRELGTSKIGGREDTRETETRWWVSPELNFWVKRTKLRGDSIETSIAVERFQN